MPSTRDDMLRVLHRGGIKSERVLAAMSAVPRQEFIAASSRDYAYDDRALAIDCGQTISQPLMVAIIAQALDIRDGDRVLDIGTGSGYQAAVLEKCGAEVVGIERIPELAAAAAQRLSRLGYRAEVRCGDGGTGALDRAPFEGIAVAAAMRELPSDLIAQLGSGGRLVAPIRTSADTDTLIRYRVIEGKPQTEDLGPCRFVPLIGHGGF